MVISLLRFYILLFLIFSYLINILIGQKSHIKLNQVLCEPAVKTCTSNLTCFKHLNTVFSLCGNPTGLCNSKDLSKCVYSIKEVRNFLNITRDVNCINSKDILPLQNIYKKFKNYFFNHTCENMILKYTFNISYGLSFHKFPLSNNNKHWNVLKKDIPYERKKRSPLNHQIQELKVQLNNELREIYPISKPIQPQVSCDYALNQICLRHIACHELWNIFRRSCIVDAQNNCRMSSSAHCWQSYEGISWTGLGNCTCYDKNSDCHWIRLQTNYNKCISEINIRNRYNTIYHSRIHTTTIPNTSYVARVSSNYQKYANPQTNIKKDFHSGVKILPTDTHSSDLYNNFNGSKHLFTTITPPTMPFQQMPLGYKTLNNYSITERKVLNDNSNDGINRNSNRKTEALKKENTKNINNEKDQKSLSHYVIDKNYKNSNEKNITTLYKNQSDRSSLNYNNNTSSLITNKKELNNSPFQTETGQISNTNEIDKKNTLKNIRITGKTIHPTQSSNLFRPNTFHISNNISATQKELSTQKILSTYKPQSFPNVKEMVSSYPYSSEQILSTTLKTIFENKMKIYYETTIVPQYRNTKIIYDNKNVSSSLPNNDKSYSTLQNLQKQM
uniref:GDNF domain-containing protein n=1 Tax=Parastrongyloides trichosuri TaxID=131310 RepID=A0A0N5A385_PARTI